MYLEYRSWISSCYNMMINNKLIFIVKFSKKNLRERWYLILNMQVPQL